MDDNSKIFKQVDFFTSIDDEVLKQVTSAFREVTYSKDEVVFQEDEVGDSFYIVKSGKIALNKKLKVDESITGELSFFMPFDYFGELALIDDEPRSGTAIAAKQTTLLKVNKQDFLNICSRHPEVMLSIVKTMSKRIRATNDKYMNMWDELLKKNKLTAVGTAASKIVHDIRNPITVIILTAQLMGSVYEGSDEFAEKIVMQANRINDMVKEILEFASGQTVSLNIEEVNLDNYFIFMVEEFQPLCETRNASLEIENEVAERVNFDQDKITRLLYNLIRNSVDAFGDNPGVIQIHSQLKDNNLHLQIKDDGPGIPKEILTDVFEPFITVNKKEGTGLGLAICKKIVTDHGGEIKVANLPEKGACFDIYLPLRADA